jgi:hypothetical protein
MNHTIDKNGKVVYDETDNMTCNYSGLPSVSSYSTTLDLNQYVIILQDKLNDLEALCASFTNSRLTIQHSIRDIIELTNQLAQEITKEEG